MNTQEQAAFDLMREALNLLEEVSHCFTREDDLPNNLIPRIDATLAAAKEVQPQAQEGSDGKGCSNVLRLAGQAYPRTCKACGLGPCRWQSACTCPSGDGSLRWPCPVHPPKGESFKSGTVCARCGCDEQIKGDEQ